MSKIKLSELRNIIREELINTLVEFETKDMPNGATWRTAGKGWAAKNSSGETNYWYGKDEAKNKKSADDWARGSSKTATTK